MVKILGIETSCDETGVAIVEDARIILSEKLSSSVDMQKKYGGVVPELASRVHTEKIIPLIESAVNEAGAKLAEIDAIAVASGPGLVGALLVGAMTAKTMAMVLGVKLVGVNHLEGHVLSAFLPNDDLSKQQLVKYDFSNNGPILILIVSGGHTELVLMEDFGVYQTIGETIDDAAGEAFDKAAKILNLPYPGGPSIAKAAESINESKRDDSEQFSLPRPMLDSGDFNFSFSGLKTALLYKARKRNLDDERVVASFADEFQEAVTDVLVKKTVAAAREYNIERVAMVGGVAANRVLRQKLEIQFGDQFFVPEFKYCTDNGVKITVAGYYKYKKGGLISWQELSVRGNWGLG